MGAGLFCQSLQQQHFCLHGRYHTGLACGLFWKAARHHPIIFSEHGFAFPVILLFYLLVTPEIRVTGIPMILAAVLFFSNCVFDDAFPFSLLHRASKAQSILRYNSDFLFMGIFRPCF